LRKSLIAAVAAFTVLSMAAVAVAQTQYPAPDPSSTVTVSPKKAGKKNKPKKVGLGLFIANNVESKTTASHIQIDLPSSLRIGAARGLAKCSASAIEAAQSTEPCPAKSLIGEGVAHAILGPYNTDPAELTLDVTAVNGGPKRVFFFVQVRDTSVVGLLDGKITKKNRRLTMSIPESLKKPDGFTYSALVDIDVDIERKSGVVTSTGCKARKHSIKTTLRFEANPTPPPSSTASTTDTVACSK
jgi:hypothetical protein